MKAQLLATAQTKEKLQGMINKFYYSENWIITDDNRAYNSKLNKYAEGVQIINKKNRWRFEMV
jgi:hypothetical protein